MTPAHANGSQPAIGRRFGRGLKGLLLWDHERGSWQYDVMVALILIFVFVTPAYWFDDKPDVRLMAEGPDSIYYRVRARQLRRYDADFRADPSRATYRLFSDRLDHPFAIADIQEVHPRGGGEAVWYDVWLRRTD